MSSLCSILNNNLTKQQFLYFKAIIIFFQVGTYVFLYYLSIFNTYGNFGEYIG